MHGHRLKKDPERTIKNVMGRPGTFYCQRLVIKVMYAVDRRNNDFSPKPDEYNTQPHTQEKKARRLKPVNRSSKTPGVCVSGVIVLMQFTLEVLKASTR